MGLTQPINRTAPSFTTRPETCMDATCWDPPLPEIRVTRSLHRDRYREDVAREDETTSSFAGTRRRLKLSHPSFSPGLFRRRASSRLSRDLLQSHRTQLLFPHHSRPFDSELSSTRNRSKKTFQTKRLDQNRYKDSQSASIEHDMRDSRVSWPDKHK